MKKLISLFIFSMMFVAMSVEAKPVKKEKKEAAKSLLRVHYLVDGKETKVKEMTMKNGQAVQITVDPNVVAKAIKAEPCSEEKPAAKKPETKKVVAPAAPAPSASEETAPSVEEEKEGEEPEEAPAPEKERTDLVPPDKNTPPTNKKPCETSLWDHWYVKYPVIIVGTGLVLYGGYKIGDHNHWWDIHVGRRR